MHSIALASSACLPFLLATGQSCYKGKLGFTVGLSWILLNSIVFCVSDTCCWMQLSSDSVAESNVMEAGVRIGDVYALLVGEQCCLCVVHLMNLDHCQHPKALLCSFLVSSSHTCQTVPTLLDLRCVC